MRLQGEGTFTETVPVLDDSGHMDMQDVERHCVVDVALRWGTGYDPTAHLRQHHRHPKGGSHCPGSSRACTAAVKAQVDAQARRLKVGKDEKLEKDDVLAGMTAVITVRLAEPQFEGQTKEVLGTAAVRGIVRKVVEGELTTALTSGKREEKAQATAVLDKVVTEMKSRISARLHKETQRRKNALESSSLPPKLKDCRSDDVANTELFLVEGDSALGTAMARGTRSTRRCCRLRGKILNVQKASVTDMLKNAECASIIQVVGGRSGRSFDLSSVRYGKIVLMTDADVDGAHIRTLLLTLFFRTCGPSSTPAGTSPPCPRCTGVRSTGRAGREREVIYTYSDAELRRVTATSPSAAGRTRTPSGTSLGEMDEDQLAETTMERAHRTLRRVTVSDGAVAERVFELLMGNDVVAPRKDFIIAGPRTSTGTASTPEPHLPCAPRPPGRGVLRSGPDGCPFESEVLTSCPNGRRTVCSRGTGPETPPTRTSATTRTSAGAAPQMYAPERHQTILDAARDAGRVEVAALANSST